MTEHAAEDPGLADDAPTWGLIEGVEVASDGDGVPVLTQELLDLGRSAAIAIALWDEWTHRKVESLNLLSGERARRRVSVDCTPPMIPWQEDRLIGDQIAQASLVPLTLIRKGPFLKSLDVTDDAGGSIPVLGRKANGLVAALSIAFWVSVVGSDDGSPDDALSRVLPHWPEIYMIADAPREEALERAEALIKKLNLPRTAARLVEELAELFLLVAVLPADSAPRRQVLKYSYHWEMDPIRRIGRRIVSAFGWAPLTIQFEVGALRTAASYHLECAVPEGLTATKISLPKSHGRAPTSDERTKVAHVSGRYSIAEDGRDSQAWISFLPDHNGLLPRIMWSGLAVAVIFAALLFAPDLRDAMYNRNDPATAILLFIPAFLIGLNARAGENVVVGGLLLPLRIYALLLAGLIIVGGGMLVLNIWPELTTVCFWIALVFGLLGGLASSVGWIRQVVGSWR